MFGWFWDSSVGRELVLEYIEPWFKSQNNIDISIVILEQNNVSLIEKLSILKI